MRQRVGQLQAAAADPGMVLAAHLERLVVRDRLARLGELALPGEDLAGHDERLGPGAALDQAALDEGEIGPGFTRRLAGGLAHGSASAGGRPPFGNRVSRRWKRQFTAMATKPSPRASPYHTPRPPRPSGK